MKMNFSIVSLIVAAIISGSFVQGCPTIISQKPFDLSRYLGVWYEIYRTDAPFQRGTRCVNATYSLRTDGSVQVFNQAIGADNKYTSIVGTAQVKDSNNPASLSVVFDNPNQLGGYNVIKTDYNNYAAVYSCSQTPRGQFEITWFLSRQKTLTADIVTQLKATLQNMRADTSNLLPTLQNC